MAVVLNDVVAKSFQHLFKPVFGNEIDEIVLKGGRGSTKSSFASISIVTGMMMDYHNYGLITNAVCLQKVAGYLKRTVYNNILWAIDILDVKDEWYCTKSPLQCTYIPSGQQILFSGCDDPRKIKGIKFDNGYCKYAWFEEVDQFKDMAEVRNVMQTVARGGKNLIFFCFNPPPSVNNWANFEFSKEEKYRIIHHSTYLDVPKEWLGTTFLRTAEQLKVDNEKAYRNEYLGENVGFGSEVFTNVINFPIPDDDIWKYDKHRNGLDFGYEDPTALANLHYDNKEIVFLNEIYEHHLNIDPLYEMIMKIIPYNELIIGDSASAGNISELKQKGLYIVGAKKPANSVRRGIKFLQSLKTIKIDRKRCPKAYWEFSTYEKDKDKFGEWSSNYPDRNNHLIDATRYALSDIINVQGWKIPS